MICPPWAHRFSNAATKWGISNLSKVWEAYEISIVYHYLDLFVADGGLHISEYWPFLGASPYGLVFCECCGKGLCEIKCPYMYKDVMLVTAAADSRFCLKYDDNGIYLYLDTVHPYYYQVQRQLSVTGVKCIDFVVWTTKDLFVQRVLPDTDFRNRMLTRTSLFYKRGVLPEILGLRYTLSSA